MDLFRDFSIITWNIRGAWGQSSMRQVCDIVNLHYPSLFLVFESHGLFSRVEDFWNRLGYIPLFVQEVVGHSGHLGLVLYSEYYMFVDSFHEPSNNLFNQKKEYIVWYCTTVYVSLVPSNRHHLWDHLGDIRNQIRGSWLLIRDFDDIILPSKVSGGQFNSSRACLMADMMNACGVMDLEKIRGWFTWQKNIQADGHVRKKLDKCLVNSDWCLMFP